MSSDVDVGTGGSWVELPVQRKLPDFHKWCRVTRHSRVFRGLMGCQRTPRVWSITATGNENQKWKKKERVSCGCCYWRPLLNRNWTKNKSFWVVMSTQFPLASYVKLECQCRPRPCDFSFSIISKLWKHFTLHI